MKKYIFILICALFISIFFLYKKYYKEKKTTNITTYGVLLKAKNNPFWLSVKKGLEEEAKKENIELKIYSSETDSSAKEQLELCEAMLDLDIDALIVASVNGNNLIPCLKKFSDKKVDIVDFDTNLDYDTVRYNKINISFTIGSNNYNLGKEAGKYLISKMKYSYILVIEGIQTSTTNKNRVNGFEDIIKTNENFSIVTSIPGDWSRKKAKTITLQALKDYPYLNAIYATNDLMALGATDALLSQNYKDIVIVIGTDGIADAIESIHNDELDATIAQIPYLMGRKTITTLKEKNTSNLDYVYTDYVYTDILTLDKEILNNDFSETLKLLK